MTIAGVMLAAGAGSRFAGSTHKLLASFGGSTVLNTALAPMREAGFDEVIVVTGAVDLSRHLPGDVTVLQNHDWERGQSSSLQTAVHFAEHAGHEAVVVGLADQPFVTADAWRAIAEAEGDVVTAVFEGKRRPPVKLTDMVWPLLPLDGDEGARVLFRSRPDLVQEVVCAGKPFDIDTQEDLDRWN